MTLTQLAPRRSRPTTLSEALRLEVRAELAVTGISGSALARALGMSQQAVSDRLRGRTPWSVDETAALEYVLGLEAGALFRAAVVKCTPRDLNPEPTDLRRTLPRAIIADRIKTANHMICGLGGEEAPGHLTGCTCHECQPDLYDLARGERDAFGLAA